MPARECGWVGSGTGKLLDLNKLLKGPIRSFPGKGRQSERLTHAQYVITLDSDTQLPRARPTPMIGAMAHPLNRAVIDPDLRLSLRVMASCSHGLGSSVQSASRSRLASIYSGQTGFDITRERSPILPGFVWRGYFFGQGIYEINALHAVLDRRFPRNSLLSHDLIEARMPGWG